MNSNIISRNFISFYKSFFAASWTSLFGVGLQHVPRFPGNGRTVLL